MPKITRPDGAAMHRVADCMIRRVIPQPTEWENIGNEVKAAFVFARSDFIKVFNRFHFRKPSTTCAVFFKRPPRNISAIINTNAAV